MLFNSIASVIANVGVLAIFKYYLFAATNLGAVFTAAGLPVQLPLLQIVLPIGLSFHTFQAMSYTIEVYRGSAEHQRHPARRRRSHDCAGGRALLYGPGRRLPARSRANTVAAANR